MLDRTKLVQRLFSGFAIFCFTWILFNFLVMPRIGAIYSPFRAKHSLLNIVVLNNITFVLTLLLCVGVLRLVKNINRKKDFSSKKAWMLLVLELLIYGLVILLFLKYIGYYKTVDDAQVVYNWVIHYTRVDPWAHSSWLMHYLYANPQNLFLALVYKVITVLLGNYFWTVIIVFLIIYLLSLCILFSTMQVLKLNNRIALLTIQLAIFSIQVTLHSAIAYTDILAFFFTSLTAYCFARYVLAGGGYKYVWAFLVSLASLLAFFSKGTSLIIIIALCLFMFISNRKTNKLVSALPILVLILGNVGWAYAINHVGVMSDSNYGQPNAHYIMMGLSNSPIPADLSTQQAAEWSVGTYSAKDQQYSWNLFFKQRLPKSDISKHQMAEYVRRVRSMTPAQLVAVLNNKVSVAWGSGDLKTSFSLIRGTHDEVRGKKIFSDGTSGLFLYVVMSVSQLMLYIGIIYALAKNWQREDKFTLFGTIFLCGYFVFLLLWEVNPRYAIGILPFGLIMIGLSLGKKPSKKVVFEKEKHIEK